MPEEVLADPKRRDLWAVVLLKGRSELEPSTWRTWIVPSKMRGNKNRGLFPCGLWVDCWVGWVAWLADWWVELVELDGGRVLWLAGWLPGCVLLPFVYVHELHVG